MSGRLVGVGVGPGDPELLTVKAVRALRDADRVFLPVTSPGEAGLAESVLRAHVPAERCERLAFAMGDAAARARRWDEAGRRISDVAAPGGVAAFATIGDPNLYSTFSYVAATVRALAPGVAVETIPGITAMQALAARSGTVLAEGRERLALLPYSAGTQTLRAALDGFETVVLYKAGRGLADVLDAASGAGRLDLAVYGAHVGLEGEEIRPLSDLRGCRGPYMSTVILPSRRSARGGAL